MATPDSEQHLVSVHTARNGSVRMKIQTSIDASNLNALVFNIRERNEWNVVKRLFTTIGMGVGAATVLGGIVLAVTNNEPNITEVVKDVGLSLSGVLATVGLEGYRRTLHKESQMILKQWRAAMDESYRLSEPQVEESRRVRHLPTVQITHKTPRL